MLCQNSKYFEREPLLQEFESAVFEEVRDKCSCLASRTPDSFTTWGLGLEVLGLWALVFEAMIVETEVGAESCKSQALTPISGDPARRI